MKYLLKKITLLFIFSLLLQTNVQAENMIKLGNNNVHYIAIGSTFLTPKIAKTYGIERSRYNSLINISVLDNSQENTPAKTVSIMGKAKNNIGQLKSLTFIEVKEGKAIYYLAQVNYANEETLHFDISINDGTEKQHFKFSQKFYVD